MYTFAASIPKGGAHGERFTYRSPNTDVVGWLVARAEGGKRPDAVLQDRIWSRLGAEGDAYMSVDPSGNAAAAEPHQPLALTVRQTGEKTRYLCFHGAGHGR